MHSLFLEEFKNILIKNKKIKHLFFLNENDQIPLSYYYNSKNNYEELDKLFIKENAKIKTISNNPNAIFFSLKIRK